MKLKFIIPAITVALLASGCSGDTGAESDQALYETFKNPGAQWRGKPFWAWNGRLEKDELMRQLGVFRDMGMGGAFMHSRVGLQTEYLGSEWFDLTNAVADSAARMGLEAYLYDEDRWPSGSAGGMVTLDNPHLRMNFVELFTTPAADFRWDSDSILAAFACRLDGINYSNLKRIYPDTPEKEYEDMTVLKFLHRTHSGTDVYNGGTYIDVFNPEATKKFMELTHEKYKEYCGTRFGNEIKGIFTDEPHRGGLFTDFDGNPHGVGNNTRTVPWTPRMADEYRARFGGDLIADLPKLFLREDGQRISPVKWQYCELAESLFLENFAKPQYDWCTENGIAYTGHVLHEDNLTSQVAMQGSLMRYYQYMHIPGMDLLTEGNRSYWVAKQLSSAGRQLGKKQLLSETYGVTGWQFDFRGHKAVGDWQALFGVNMRCHHLSWYTMQGEAKRDYPASIFFQSAWWRDYKYVEDYYSRLGFLLSQGKPECDLLVINPVESVWSQVAVGAFDNLTPATPEIKEMEKRYADLFHWLAGSRIDFDYGDEEMMSRMASISKNEDSSPVLKIGQASYRTVLVGNMETMRSSTADILEDFIKAGGKVIFAGDIPPYVNATADTRPAKLAEKSIRTSYTEKGITDAVKKTIRPTVKVSNANTGENIPQIYGQVRWDGHRHYIALMNTDRTTRYGNVKIEIPYTGKAALWDCRTGEVFAQETEKSPYGIEITTSFEPTEEKVFTVSWKMPPMAMGKKHTEEIKRTPLPEKYAYRLDEPNICVLDVATWHVKGEKEQPLTEILKIDRALRERYGLPYRGGDMLQPWFAEKYLDDNSQALGQMALSFPFEADSIPGDSVLYLCMETPERFTVTVNGKTLDTSGDEGWFIDPSLRRIPLHASMLEKGENIIGISGDFCRDTNLEAILLTGNFGVRLDSIRRILTVLPDSLSIGDITSQGLPFYSGAVTYLTDSLPVPETGGKVFIETAGYDGACLKGPRGQMAAWAPYRLDVTEEALKGIPAEVTVVLTRRNTFGPLHALPARMGAYGPFHWVTEGDNFTMDRYVLLPAGLTHKPMAITEKTR